MIMLYIFESSSMPCQRIEVAKYAHTLTHTVHTLRELCIDRLELINIHSVVVTTLASVVVVLSL